MIMMMIMISGALGCCGMSDAGPGQARTAVLEAARPRHDGDEGGLEPKWLEPK